MATPTFIHIVPALPPQIDDVGDYALNLALHLRQSHGIESRFIVCGPQWNGPSHVEGFVVRRLRLLNEAGIWGSLASAKERHFAVLLHYAGYGYHGLGVPLWLYRGIKSWLGDRTGGTAGGQKQFATVFHELWGASVKPWKREFYLRMLQKRLVEDLHRRSTISVTSTRRMQALLEGIQPHKTLCLPIPSNLPVLERPKFGSRRNAKLRVAIFGRQCSRSATVRAHANLLRTLDKKNLLSGAMLLGKGLDGAGRVTEDVHLLQRCVSRERIEALSELSPSDVSGSLSQADLLLSHCCGELACKSGAFMAALAAGCPGVLCDGENAAPLQESEHFIASDDSQSSVKRFERITENGLLDGIATAGRLWYERYADWKVIAGKYQEVFFHAAFPLKGRVESAETFPRMVKMSDSL